MWTEANVISISVLLFFFVLLVEARRSETRFFRWCLLANFPFPLSESFNTTRERYEWFFKIIKKPARAGTVFRFIRDGARWWRDEMRRGEEEIIKILINVRGRGESEKSGMGSSRKEQKEKEEKMFVSGNRHQMPIKPWRLLTQQRNYLISLNAH